MKLADEGAKINSATVVAKEPVVAYSLPIPVLERFVPAVRAKLTANVAKVLADRLRSNNETAAEAMQRELDENRERVASGILAVSLIAIIAIYNLAVAALRSVNPAALPGQAFVSPLFILTPCVPIVFLIRRSHHPAKHFGLTLEGFPRAARDAIRFTIPVLVVITLFKAAWTRLDPRLGNEPLFDTHAFFTDGRFDLRFYVLSIVIYALVCPAQEFFTRSGLQTALDGFLPRTDDQPNWAAIVVSNLVFALAHSYIGFGFAVGAFVPGLFWGWLYDRQRSLLTVSLSHAIVGVFALQVLGIQPIIGGH
jgi:membrane protease YdiL (CAAX protease family)